MALWCSLLKEKNYFQYKFPVPQYLGAKYIHRNWIRNFIPRDSVKILDGFSGSHSIAYMCKQLGKQVVSNDFLKFNFFMGKALVENPAYILSEKELTILFSDNRDPAIYNLIESLYTDLFFLREDAQFADSFRSNIPLLKNPYHQALALAIMCRSMTRKVTMGHFAHTRALAYAGDPVRIKRNRSLVIPLKNLFMSILKEYNAAIFDNGQINATYNENILDLLPKLSQIDVAYFDPPYCDSHADYQSFYHLLETYANYWKDKNFINRTRRYEPKKYSGFDKKCDIMENLSRLFDLAADIPVWLLSYNDRSYPPPGDLFQIIKSRRKVRIEQFTYSSSRGGQGECGGKHRVFIYCREVTGLLNEQF